MENISTTNIPDDENVYRALRDSVLQLHNFVSETARKMNPEYLVDISWDIRDNSLINWISYSRCYLIRPGHKIQFLSKPRFLPKITIELQKGDKILICSDTFLEKHSDADLDEILKNSESVDDACQNLMLLTRQNNGIIGEANVVVMEVKEPSIEPQPVAAAVSEPSEKDAKVKTISKDSKVKSTSGGSVAAWAAALLIGLFGLLWFFKKDNIKNFIAGRGWGNISKADLKDTSSTFLYISKDTSLTGQTAQSTTAQPNDNWAGMKPDTPAKQNDKTTGFEPITKPKEEPKSVEVATTPPAEPKKVEVNPVKKTEPKRNIAQNTTPKAEKRNSEVQSSSSGNERSVLESQLTRWEGIKAELEANPNADPEALQNARSVVSRIKKRLGQ
jgi:hypothetical protein